MKNKIVWSDLSPHGDLIPMSEFKNYMEHEFMIPGWDGSGKYATEDKMTNLYVPEKPEDLDLSYSHVIWFNV